MKIDHCSNSLTCVRISLENDEVHDFRGDLLEAHANVGSCLATFRFWMDRLDSGVPGLSFEFQASIGALVELLDFLEKKNPPRNGNRSTTTDVLIALIKHAKRRLGAESFFQEMLKDLDSGE